MARRFCRVTISYVFSSYLQYLNKLVMIGNLNMGYGFTFAHKHVVKILIASVMLR